MDNPKLSIILPIYRVEKYLPLCIKSILGQEYKNIEVIAVVDKESHDRCESIVDAYAKKDSRVYKYMRGHNGLGDARNCGMEHASGDYIIFVDTDDHYCKKDYLSEIVEAIKESEPDYIITRSRKHFEETGKVIQVSADWGKNVPHISTAENKMVYILDSGSFIPSAWGKAYRRGFLNDNNLRFTFGYSEDLDWTGQVLNLTKRIEILMTDGYCIEVRSDSLSRTRNSKQIVDALEKLKTWSRCIEGYTEYENAQRGFIAYFYFVLLGLIPFLPREDRGEIYIRCQEVKHFIKYARSRKAKLSKVLCTVMGDKFGSWLLSKYISIGQH